MERELWTIIKWGLRRLPRRCPRNAVYANTEILAVFLWAAMHNRPLDWASKRSSWPIQAWRQRLPDQSTMSRRLKDQSVWDDLQRLLDQVQSRFGNEHEGRSIYIVDGKPLHRACEANDIQLIAPRRRPGTGLGWVKGGHSAGRLRSIEITEGPSGEWDRVHRFVRLGIERFFGTLATRATGLFASPPWVRRLHRVRAWVAAKLVINAARIVRRREIHT